MEVDNYWMVPTSSLPLRLASMSQGILAAAGYLMQGPHDLMASGVRYLGCHDWRWENDDRLNLNSLKSYVGALWTHEKLR